MAKLLQPVALPVPDNSKWQVSTASDDWQTQPHSESVSALPAAYELPASARGSEFRTAIRRVRSAANVLCSLPFQEVSHTEVVHAYGGGSPALYVQYRAASAVQYSTLEAAACPLKILLQELMAAVTRRGLVVTACALSPPHPQSRRLATRPVSGCQ